MESNGNITSDVPTKFHQDQNHWAFLGAPNASYAAPIEELHKFNIEDLIAEVKAKLLLIFDYRCHYLTTYLIATDIY